MFDYSNKNVLIIGAGLTGLSCIRYFASFPKARLSVMDSRPNPPFKKEIPSHINCYFGNIDEKIILASDLIVLSPGFSSYHPFIKKARDIGIEIVGDVELFCRINNKPIIAITGSNGKSTVSSLVTNMAREDGLKVECVANIGYPVLDIVDKLDDLDLVVMELSSFQLETVRSLRPLSAVVLNVVEDHLDRYPSFQEYKKVKMQIYDKAKYAIINTNENTINIPPRKDQIQITFGSNKGDFYLCHDLDKTWLRGDGEKILETSEMKIIGRHNYLNALAALALAKTANISSDACIRALKGFTGLPHRFQIAFEKDDITWINDSKSTNVSSTKAALDGLNTRGTLHLLLGGNSKNNDFTSLKDFLRKERMFIYCFGQSAKEIACVMPDISIVTDTLEEAVKNVCKRLSSGDVVLLSPGCSSTDQFENYAERGVKFVKLAKTLG